MSPSASDSCIYFKALVLNSRPAFVIGMAVGAASFLWNKNILGYIYTGLFIFKFFSLRRCGISGSQPVFHEPQRNFSHLPWSYCHGLSTQTASEGCNHTTSHKVSTHVVMSAFAFAVMSSLQPTVRFKVPPSRHSTKSNLEANEHSRPSKDRKHNTRAEDQRASD